MDAPAAKPTYPWYVRIVVGRNPLYTLFRTLVWATLLVVMFKFVLLGVRVHGKSMEPTFQEGQIKLINRIAYMRHPPRRGDIVAIRADELNAVIIKRVIGLPGETVFINKRGEVYINGKHFEEPYVIGQTTYNGSRTLQPNEYWLFGDNREISATYFKRADEIVGKVIF